MHDHTLHCGRKHFCCYSLQAFSTEEILKRHIKDCFKIDGKQGIKMLKNGDYLKFKNFERKIKAPFMTYADFENILVPEKNGKQNPDESYTNKYQKHIACSYGYKLVCVDDKFWKPFKSYFGEDAVYSLSNSSIGESKYCTDMTKKHFNRKLGNVEFVIMFMLTDSSHRDCNTNIRLNHKISIEFHNLKNYYSHLIM